MRVNIYSQELTSEVRAVRKESGTGRAYAGERREEMAQAFEEIARHFRDPRL